MHYFSLTESYYDLAMFYEFFRYFSLLLKADVVLCCSVFDEKLLRNFLQILKPTNPLAHKSSERAHSKF